MICSLVTLKLLLDLQGENSRIRIGLVETALFTATRILQMVGGE